jgi:DNA-binding FadR family transcriptional regulator
MSIQSNTKIWSTKGRSRSVKESVVYAVLDAMHDGSYPTDQAMPPEPEMCKRLGVSRVAFREAVKQLEVLGFLRIDRGNGTIATTPSFACLGPIIEFLGKMGKIDLAELHHVRLLIEVDAVKLVAAQGHTDLVARLEAILDEVEKNFEKESSHIDLDYAFHKAILDACPNRILPLILSPFSEQLYKSRKLSFRNLPAARKTVEMHRKILNAIRDNAADEAGRLMTEHLVDTAKDLNLEKW